LIHLSGRRRHYDHNKTMGTTCPMTQPYIKEASILKLENVCKYSVIA
jgi:hypothetical protein